MQKVAIVNAGGYGDHSAEKGSYDSFVELLERQLKRATWGLGKEQAADVSVVRSTEEALRWVGRRGVIVYVTRGMARDAKKVTEEREGVRVVLFTGVLPEREVVWVSKHWGPSAEQMENIILRG